MILSEAHGYPLGVMIASASPHEVTLAETTIEMRFVSEVPKRLLGDMAYDSDALDARLLERGIEMIAPNRSNRKVATQDGRPLRRYRRRWKVERLIAWLHNFRRIVVRWDYKAENYLAFVQLGCILCLLRVF
jgi:transposase